MLTKKFCTIALIVLSCSAVYSQSTTVSFSGAPGQRDVTYNGLAVPDGNYVQIGYFSPGFDVAGNAFNIPSLAAAWHGLGFTNIATIFGQAGRFAGNLSTSDPTFAGNRICLWIFKTTGNGDPAQAAYANVQGYGLYSAPLASNWLFPAPGVPPANMTSITSSEVTQAYYGSFDASHLILNPVPEPSTLVLLAAAGGSLVWFLRNHKKP
jgi:hypothetical protein